MFKNFLNRVRLRVSRHAHPSIALLLLCLSAGIAFGQATGSLSGVVQDASKAVVPGAKIELVNQASKSRRSTTANNQGFFSMQALQSATYDLTISAKGFESEVVTGIQIDPGDHRTIPDVQLRVGEVNASVTVTSTTAGVSLDSPEKSSLITAEDIKRLSTVGRDATELIKFLPGFAVSTGGGLSNSSTNNNSQTVGFGSSSTSSFSANGATPQTGATQVVSDGASTVDPGDMGASIANINVDMVQEIKVQTSNFGADSAKGPVVINAVGKSGGSSYHGTAYIFARNGVLNANEWLNNNTGVTRPNSSYYFPGVNVGGPVKIPGTDFNHNKRLTFFTAFELYRQQVYQQTVTSFVPTAAMLGGDLTPASIASALNVSVATLTTQCPNFYTSGTLNGSGGFCFSPGYTGGTYTQQAQQINAGTVSANGKCDLVNSPGVSAGCLPVDPHAAIFAKFWPKPNRVPQAVNGLASDGFNYVKAITAADNGYQYRGRVDENFTDNTKLYVTYNLEKINSEQPIQDGYYAGSDIIPFPTSAFSNTKSHSVSLNFTHVFGPTLTNEVVAAGTYFYQPSQLANPALVSDANTGWTGGRYYDNGATQLPKIIDYENGVPDFAMNYFPAGSKYFRKFSYNASDNLTWQYRTHTLKFGIYDEVTANNQVPYNATQGEYAFNHYNAGCAFSVTAPAGVTASTSALQNNIANFLQGCGGFTQANNSNAVDLHFKTIDFYATDEWKATSKLTLTFGVRFDHLGPWNDPHGVGLAVWNPPMKGTIFAGVTKDQNTFPGISWHAKDSSIPITGSPSRLLFYSPRAGLAYDMYGNGKTVFRGGWGAYRFHDSYNDGAGPLSTTSGSQSFNNGNLSCTYAQIQTHACAATGGANGSAVPFGIYAVDPKDDQQPVTYNYNLTMDQQISHGMNLELSYVGNRSEDTLTAGNLNNQNYIPLGALFQPDPITHTIAQPGNSQQIQQDYRPYPNYTTVHVANHIGYGNYNAFQGSISKQKGKFIYGFNYTWAKALGIRGDYRTGAVGDPSTLRNNYGYLGFNRNHAANWTYSYQVGESYKGNRLIGAVLNQWEISGITGLQSGPDVAVLAGNSNFGLSGGGQYTAPGSTTPTTFSINNTNVLGTPDISLQPVVTCNPSSNLQKNSMLGRQYVNQNCFALPAIGTNGNFELPDIHGPAYFNSDLTVQRSFKLTERQNVQFRMAGFNFLNHPLPQLAGGTGVHLNLSTGDPVGSTFSTPQAAIAAAVPNSVNFGYTPYKTGFRIVEFGARYNF